jgi:hypothetical protein
VILKTKPVIAFSAFEFFLLFVAFLFCVIQLFQMAKAFEGGFVVSFSLSIVVGLAVLFKALGRSFKGAKVFSYACLIALTLPLVDKFPAWPLWCVGFLLVALPLISLAYSELETVDQ